MRLVLTICGTTFEVLGLVFVVAEATRARRDEYGDLSAHLIASRWLRHAFFHDEPPAALEPERRAPDKFEIALALASRKRSSRRWTPTRLSGDLSDVRRYDVK